jgi:predicted peroxiredoxin
MYVQFEGKVFEYLVKNYYRKSGWLTFRCAGSRPFDLLVLKGGPIYFTTCKIKKSIQSIRQKLIENGFGVMRQAGHTEYVLGKNNVIILLMLAEPYQDMRVIHDMTVSKIQVIQVNDIEKNFLSLVNAGKANICKEIKIIECKLSGKIMREQLINIVDMVRAFGLSVFSEISLEVDYRFEKREIWLYERLITLDGRCILGAFLPRLKEYYE